MVQKKFNVFQAVFCFVLMYTTIVSGILLRESPLTPIGIGVITVIVLIMLKLRNKVVPSTDSFMTMWLLTILLADMGTLLTFYIIADIIWKVFQLPYDLGIYDVLMAMYMILVSIFYVNIVYSCECVRYNSFGLSNSEEKIRSNVTVCNYKLELYESYELKDHFAFKWIRRLAIHSIYPIASFLIYIAVTYKQAPKVGYGIVGVLSVITFIFIFKVVLEGREVDKSDNDNKPKAEDIRPSTEQK